MGALRINNAKIFEKVMKYLNHKENRDCMKQIV